MPENQSQSQQTQAKEVQRVVNLHQNEAPPKSVTSVEKEGAETKVKTVYPNGTVRGTSIIR